MTAKEMKVYDLIVKIGNSLPEDANVPTLFGELAALDFTRAFEMWEYMMVTYSCELEDMLVAEKLERRVFEVLSERSEPKLKQLLADATPLLKAIYTSSATAATGGNLAYLCGLIMNSKIDAATEILKMVASNKNTNIEYGERMRAILDETFAMYCAKNNTKVPSLNRKQGMMLLEFALKIKGPTKNLLVQRIKELN